MLLFLLFYIFMLLLVTLTVVQDQQRRSKAKRDEAQEFRAAVALRHGKGGGGHFGGPAAPEPGEPAPAAPPPGKKRRKQDKPVLPKALDIGIAKALMPQTSGAMLYEDPAAKSTRFRIFYPKGGKRKSFQQTPNADLSVHEALFNLLKQAWQWHYEEKREQSEYEELRAT